MRWHLSHRFDPRALPLADRHYNRRKVGSPQFVPPGRCLVMLTRDADALWVTSYPFKEYVRHAWAGALVCSLFRNESEFLSSELIREACAATAATWPIPPLGMITFVDAKKTRPKRDPGFCYLRAGFVNVGTTKKEGLVALQLTPDKFPPPRPALGAQERLGISGVPTNLEGRR
jgi:hypothetical protein